MDHLITIEVCAEVVRASKVVENNASFDVVRFRFNKVPGLPGYLGDYAHLVISVRKGGKQITDFRYFVKCPPLKDLSYRKFIEKVGYYTKESECYKEIFPKFQQSPEQVQKWRPSCWLVKDNLMIMEDLVDNGFQAMPYRKEFGQGHMLRIIDSLAQMHACSLDLEINQLNGIKIGDKFELMHLENIFKRDNTWFRAGLQGIKKAALCASKYSKNPSNKQTIETEIDSRMDQIYQLIQPLAKYQSVVVHRDLWFNNFMFRFPTDPTSGMKDFEKPSSCVLLDFQLARYLPPAVDFLCALYILTRRFHRDAFYESYVDHYYQSLTTKLEKLDLDIKTVLPWAQFRESLDHYRLVGLLWSGVLQSFVNLPEGYLSDLRINHPQTYKHFFFVCRDDVIEEFLNKDTYYRDNFIDKVDEMLEYLFEFK